MLRTVSFAQIVHRAFWPLLALEALAVLFITHPWIAGDSGIYLGLAKSLSEGRYGLVTLNGFEWDPLRPPGYATILWIILYVLGLPFVTVILVQLAVYALSIFIVDRSLVEDWGARLAIRCLALIYPFPLIYSGYAMTEVWALGTITPIAIIICKSKLRTIDLVIVGALAGAAALIRSDLLLASVVVSGALTWRFAREVGLSLNAIGRALIPLLCVVVAVFPYALWNRAHFGRLTPLPVAGALGTSLYLATWQEKVPLSDLLLLYEGRATERAIRSGLIQEVIELNRRVGAPLLTSPFDPQRYPTQRMQIEITKVSRDKAIERIKEHPADYAKHVMWNTVRLWITGEYPKSVPIIVRAALTSIAVFTMFAGYIGALLAIFGRERFRKWRPAALVMFYPLAIHIWIHTEARYTAAARPLRLLFAALAIAQFAKTAWQFRQASHRGLTQPTG